MRRLANGTATFVLLMLVGNSIFVPQVEARVVLPPSGSQYQRGLSNHEFLLEGGLAEPMGDQKDELYLVSDDPMANILGMGQGTGYEIGSMSIIKGSRNLDEAKQFYDWALSTDAQNLALEVNAFQVPSNTGSNTSDKAPDMSSITLIDYDFKTYGSSATRKGLLQKWDEEVSVLPQ